MHEKGLTKVLIANRGEIAVRICRTLKEMGIASVAVYSDADRNSQHVGAADEAVALGGQTAAESYLRGELILQAAKDTGAQGIIPGYGRCDNEQELVDAFESVKRMGENFFSDSGVFIERFVARARHVEVQIFGDGNGKVLALGERECSLQRRNQKVVEETPAPNLPQATREKLHASAVRLGESVNYQSAGTVEYIYDDERDEFYFLEVNTRLQVEHGVTEAVFGVDLVAWMVMLANFFPV